MCSFETKRYWRDGVVVTNTEEKQRVVHCTQITKDRKENRQIYNIRVILQLYHTVASNPLVHQIRFQCFGSAVNVELYSFDKDRKKAKLLFS